ncbi:MAG: tRNA (5-methylaminomethyl-2-thiouridine)(34)-methyltransferase MnmD [Pseudomonadota bacterium]
MPRLPASADITWKPDGTPVSARHGDIYFTAGDGLAESRAVFLKGNGLPDRWQDRTHFTVAETGFGTGLNILALWSLWQAHRPSAEAWLHVVSFEGFPMQRDDAERALSVWPEIAPLAAKLIDRWPHPARGVRQVRWPEDRISLTLHIGDIAEALDAAEFEADAWFLDGFSPARNAEMWTPELYARMAERSAPGATAATFTVAGDVRRGLASAGFDVSKAPGHGRKRERLEAFLPDGSPLLPSQAGAHRIAILGAGIMGACLARTLADFGASPTVFDPSPTPSSGGSGNPLALVMPRLDAADTVQARLLIDAYLAARSIYSGCRGAMEADVHQTPRDGKDETRFAKVLADPPLPLEDLEAIRGGGLLHKRAMIVEPATLIANLLEGVEMHLGAELSVDLKQRRVDDTPFDAIIVANGMAAQETAPWLGLTGKLGQVEYAAGLPDAPASALASGQYALATGDKRLWGATYATAQPGMNSGTNTAVTQEARASNAEGLAALAPWWMGQVQDMTPVSRASMRATTPDRFPMAGQLPDVSATLETFAPLAKGQAVHAAVTRVEGVWLATGLGSRGFTFAPWISALIAAQILGLPIPVTKAARESVDPARTLFRAIKRGHALSPQGPL